ncbi:MAG: orotate phosphoribosyltransferase [Burkholderiaceae bacterium]
MELERHQKSSAAVRAEFIRFCVGAGILRFGEFQTKAGRLSPYFFNAGLFSSGALLGRLGEFYARTLIDARERGELSFDMLFGPAYKGITLAAATAIEAARLGHDLPFAYNRKEAKDHGEGGNLVGAPLQGNVLIIDDVISAGTSVRESVALIEQAGARPAGVLIALDRQERGRDEHNPRSAAQEVTAMWSIPVLAIADLSDLLAVVGEDAAGPLAVHRDRIAAYRDRFGVA